MNKQNQTKKFTDTENRAVVTRGEEGWGYREGGWGDDRVKAINCIVMDGN